MLYIILGMHKSGTTLMSEMLHLSGINMVENYDPKEKYDSVLGKMERREVVDINNEILNSKGVDSLDIHEPGINYSLSKELINRMTTLLHHSENKYQDWGIKDPRFCLTYHLWRFFLPDHKIIIVFRNPTQVVKHYSQYYTHFKKVKRSYQALKAYYRHNDHILEILKNTSNPTLVLNYEDLMESDVMLKPLSHFTEREIVDTRKPGLYRMIAKKDLKTAILNILDLHRASSMYNYMKKIGS